jgi:hypothetical protein
VTFLAVGGTALVAKFMVASIQLDAKVLQKKGVANKNLDTDLDAAPKLVDAYNALDTKAGVLADALPTTVDFPALIVEMENIANGSGLKLKTVAPELASQLGTSSAAAAPASSSGAAPVATSGASEPTPQPYTFTLSYDGTYDSLVRLLTSLETSARPMRVIGVQATGSGSALSGVVDVQSYYMDKAQVPISQETVK